MEAKKNLSLEEGAVTCKQRIESPHSKINKILELRSPLLQFL